MQAREIREFRADPIPTRCYTMTRRIVQELYAGCWIFEAAVPERDILIASAIARFLSVVSEREGGGLLPIAINRWIKGNSRWLRIVDTLFPRVDAFLRSWNCILIVNSVNKVMNIFSLRKSLKIKVN